MGQTICHKGLLFSVSTLSIVAHFASRSISAALCWDRLTSSTTMSNGVPGDPNERALAPIAGSSAGVELAQSGINCLIKRGGTRQYFVRQNKSAAATLHMSLQELIGRNRLAIARLPNQEADRRRKFGSQFPDNVPLDSSLLRRWQLIFFDALP